MADHGYEAQLLLMCGLHAHRSDGLLKRSLRVVISFTMAALLMSVAAAPCHLQGIPRCQGRPCLVA